MNIQHNYRSLLGESAWNKLHPAVQARFSEPAYQHAVTYVGNMEEVYLSRAGKCLAHLCRLIGTPLALYSARNIPTEVQVYPDPKLAGMTWDRYYQYPDKGINRVKSTKCIVEDIGLIEVVGCGFSMQLKIYEQDGALCFESTEFFLQIGTLRLPIPNLLTPGKTIVKQMALDSHRFQFSLEVTHKILGIVFKQVGIFQSKASSPAL